MSACPHCHGTGRAMEPSPAERLREALERRSVHVTPDGRVSEAVAAELLGRAPGTLRNWQVAGGPIAAVKIRGRRSYYVSDIAAILERDD